MQRIELFPYAESRYVGKQIAFGCNYGDAAGLAQVYRDWAADHLKSDLWLRGIALDARTIEIVLAPNAKRIPDEKECAEAVEAFGSFLGAPRTISEVAPVNRIVISRMVPLGKAWTFGPVPVYPNVKRAILIDEWAPSQVKASENLLSTRNLAAVQITLPQDAGITDLGRVAEDFARIFPRDPIFCQHKQRTYLLRRK